MKPNDDKLDALLKHWRATEPETNFEANVWRKIRAAEQPVNWIEVIGRLLWRPGWSAVSAIAMAIIVGAWAGVVFAPRQIDRPSVELRFLSSGTLAGSYAQMTSQGIQ